VDDLHRYRIKTVRTDYVSDAVADESQTVLRIDGLGPGGREVSGPFQGGGNDGAAEKCARCLAQSRVGEEEKGLVVLDWTAKGGPELIAMKGRPRQCRSPVIGIEYGVAQELKSRAMKLVAAGLGEHVDDAAGITAILSVVAVGLNPKFLDGIRVGQNVTGVAQVGHVYAAVQIVVH